MSPADVASKLIRQLDAEFADSRPDMVSALERGVAVLRCFDEVRRVISHTELARLTGIPRPTVTRLAGTLVTLGLLKQDAETERFSLAAGVVSLAHAYLAGLDVRAVARPYMQDLAEQCGGTVMLAVRDGLDMVLIESVRPRTSMLSMNLDVGSRVPLPNSALGRAYLGAVPQIQREALIESLRLARGTEWTVQSTALRLALMDMQDRGHCVSMSEFYPDINSAAVPVRARDGEVLALNCGGPAYAFPESRLHEQIGPQLVITARQISEELGVPHATQR